MKMSDSDLINQIYVSDALEKIEELPDQLVDISVTSPPYNKGKQDRGWLVLNNGYKRHDDILPEEVYQDWQVRILNEIFRITKPGGSLFYNHKIRWVQGEMIHPLVWLMRSDWCLRQEIVWDRNTAANMRGWRYWQIDERIYWLYKPINGNKVGIELESKYAKLSSIWKIKPVPRMKEHPAPFPLTIPTRAIASMPGEKKKVVFDPFCGTGTTLVAAKLLGHDYIGVDNSPTYVEFAKNRLANSEGELDIIKRELGKHIVKVPFAERKKNATENWPFKKEKDERVE